MRLLIDVEIVLRQVIEEDETTEEILTSIRSRRYNTLNEEDLNKAVNTAGHIFKLFLKINN